MPRPSLGPVIAALLALAAAQAVAGGFGTMNNATVLGQRLDFSVPLRLDDGQSATPECVTADVQSGDFRVMPSAVRVAVVAGHDSGERLIRVVTDSTIDEPVVTVTVQVGCGSPMTRKFVAFVDPPLAAPARAEAQSAVPAAAVSAAPAGQAVGRTETESGVKKANVAETSTPIVSRKSGQSKRGDRHSIAVAARPAARAAKGKPSSVAAAGHGKASPAPRVAASTHGGAGPRLRLDAAPLDVMLAQANLRLADSLPPLLPAAASGAQEAASAAAGAELAVQRERLLALEASLAKLRADSQAAQASLVRLQTQLQESQTQRYANPVVYALFALCVLLAAAVALLWRARGAARAQPANWWDAATGAGAEPAHAVAAATAGRARPGPLAVPPEQWDAPDSMHGAMTVPRQGGSAASVSPVAKAYAEVSADELIDLEQQADFFVVLGQDDAAIELLTGHLAGGGGGSPLGYLKLLEIHRRRDDRAAYQRTREEFDRRFNALAPDWEADLQMGRSLEAYAPVISRLQSLWASPALAMRAIETSLFRRDTAGSTFDLPAYRELLFLYAVSRDLSEDVARADRVDVLLPFEAEESGPGTLTRLHPTRPMPIAVDAYTTQVDVDITSLGAEPAAADDPPSRHASEFSTTSGDVHLPMEKVAASR